MTDILDEIDEALENIFIMEFDDELLKENVLSDGKILTTWKAKEISRDAEQFQRDKERILSRNAESRAKHKNSIEVSAHQLMLDRDVLGNKAHEWAQHSIVVNRKITEGDIILNAIEKTGSNVGFSGWSRPDCGIRIGL